jgi:hypothetical protein
VRIPYSSSIQYSLCTTMLVITMHGKYPGFRALLCHFNGYYDSPDILKD